EVQGFALREVMAYAIVKYCDKHKVKLSISHLRVFIVRIPSALFTRKARFTSSLSSGEALNVSLAKYLVPSKRKTTYQVVSRFSFRWERVDSNHRSQ
ncbi:MAG: hypothetical protein IIX84_06360, partial [Oscillospiraceae bacterium]|nr:hypothetical protein [Oscillospiraceae bacterium]